MISLMINDDEEEEDKEQDEDDDEEKIKIENEDWNKYLVMKERWSVARFINKDKKE